MSLQQYQSQTSSKIGDSLFKLEAHKRQIDTERINVSNNPESTRNCTTLIVAPLKLIIPTLNADSIHNEAQLSTCLKSSFETYDQDSLDITNVVAYSMDKSPTFEIAASESMSYAIDGQTQEKEQEERQEQRLDDRLDQRQEQGQGQEQRLDQSVEQERRMEPEKCQELGQEKRKEQELEQKACTGIAQDRDTTESSDYAKINNRLSIDATVNVAFEADFEATSKLLSVPSIDLTRLQKEKEKAIQSVIDEKSNEFEKIVETNGKRLQAEWMHEKKTLSDSIEACFRDNLEARVEAHALRLHFEESTQRVLNQVRELLSSTNRHSDFLQQQSRFQTLKDVTARAEEKMETSSTITLIDDEDDVDEEMMTATIGNNSFNEDFYFENGIIDQQQEGWIQSDDICKEMHDFDRIIRGEESYEYKFDNITPFKAPKRKDELPSSCVSSSSACNPKKKFKNGEKNLEV